MVIDPNLVLQIILGIVTIIGLILTYVVVPFIKSKTSAEQREDIAFWVRLAVQAAEQLFPAPKLGAAKKRYVIDFLLKQGISLNEDQLTILIESAVQQLNLAKDAFLEEPKSTEDNSSTTVNP